ncbi:DUF2971 domain-containing protein [Roseateles sp.]|uniref:DUF2971 domain-containing protein n=1 Tax=Roseateles sp. TaxID=1971397 RepID=UPI002F3E8A24
MSSQRLAFKYRSGESTTLERDLAGLRDATFFSALRATLNDPFEGRFNRSDLDSQFSALRSVVSLVAPKAFNSLDSVSSALDEVLSFVDKSGIFSLSYTPLSELIWAHYGGSHKGFCIGYDLDKLVEFEPALHSCIDVKYQDAVPVLRSNQFIGRKTPEAALQEMLGIKSTAWSYEQEVRVVTAPPGVHAHDFRAVKTVYFGLRCPESTRMAVMEALAGRGVLYEQVESPRASYLLSSQRIEDAFASAPKYMANIAPINDGALQPDYLKLEQHQHKAYLFMAAEVVRREPYCREIQLVDFSGSKSTPERPVIFVQYLRAKDKWVKRYLTFSEIEKLYEELKLPAPFQS